MSLQHVEKTGGEDRHLIQHLQLTSNDVEATSFSVIGPEYLDFCSLKSVDILHDGSMAAWYTLWADEDNCSWACGPEIIRVIHEQSGEVLDYDKDREIVDWSTQSEEFSEDEYSF
ncbi:hypothetical protein F5X68DRAFT_226452 [Plectosphaerella plurivora]|uniref:Uncharacterized protein n=1 Tax=Plectosphaerella plurivora TaxID=936078 RepID=A0A9P8VNX9_9PEZI|nr:hypothetical protein F5X68DRAFT_226452 [Plectosphaerella plurivora]